MKDRIKPAFIESMDGPRGKNNESSTSNICDGFLEETTMHGANKLSSQKRKRWHRFIWGTAMLVCSGYLIYTITTEIQNFYSYPTTTAVDLDITKELDFPAITLCNLSPFNKSKVQSSEKDMNYGLSLSRFNSFAQAINWSDPFYKENGYFEPVTYQTLRNFSMELSEVLRLCMFDFVGYNCSQMFEYSFTILGPCYTFNQDGRFKTTMKGSTYNLNIEAFIDQSNYYFSFTMGSGIKVIIHDPSEKPDAGNDGLIVPPGTIGYISIEKHKYEYLPSPFKAFKDMYCLDLEAEKLKDPLKYSNYSTVSCFEDCYGEIVYSRINCTPNGYSGGGDFCSRYEIKEKMNELLKLLGNTSVSDKCNKRCRPQCKYTRYSSQISYGQYPSLFISGQLQRFYGENLTLEFLRENFLEIHIYYNDLVTKTTKQVAVYPSWDSLFANFGGKMGLFLGASIITIVELAEFCIYVIAHIFAKFITVRSSSNVKSFKDQESHKADSKTTEVEWKQRSI